MSPFRAYNRNLSLLKCIFKTLIQYCSQRVGDVVPGVVVWSCIVITAGPHQQLLPLPNLLYQIKYDDDDDDCRLKLNEFDRKRQEN